MPLCGDAATVNIAQQQQNLASLWHQYRRLLAIRAASPSLRQGEYRLLAQEKNAIHFLRECAQEQVWVAINFGDAVRNPWHEIPAETLYGVDTEWLGKNQCVIKRSFHGKAQ